MGEEAKRASFGSDSGLLARSSACPGSLPACGARLLRCRQHLRCAIPPLFGACAAGGLPAVMQVCSCSVRSAHAHAMPCALRARLPNLFTRCLYAYARPLCSRQPWQATSYKDLGDGQGGAHGEGLEGWLRAKGPSWSRHGWRFRCGSGGWSV